MTAGWRAARANHLLDNPASPSEVSLKYKAGWTPAQRAAADAKAAALTKADTVVTPSPVRGGTTQERYRREQGFGPAYRIQRGNGARFP